MLTSPALSELAEIFDANGSKLYVVGGATRDYFLGRSTEDIDVASSLKPNEVIELLKNKDFEITEFKKFGTIIIKRGCFRAEHTTFRLESYKNDGSHKPTEIIFTDDIGLDAKRRDFTVNAIYYDIKNRKFIDFFNGISDCKNKRLKPIKPMKKTFNEDALRILRYLRFSAKYSFKSDPLAKPTVKKCLPLLKTISNDRIRHELTSILFSSEDFEIQKRGVLILNDFDISKTILKRQLKLPKTFQSALSKEEFCLYNNTVFELLSSGVKEFKQLSQFLSDINSIIKAIKTKTEYATLRYLVVMNYTSIKKCFPLLKFLYPKQTKSLEDILLLIQNGGIITSVKKLAISPEEIVECGILSKNISLVQKILLEKVIRQEVRNERRHLRNLILNETKK